MGVGEPLADEERAIGTGLEDDWPKYKYTILQFLSYKAGFYSFILLIN